MLGAGSIKVLRQEAETLEVLFAPASLVLNHPFECFQGKGLTRTVKRNRHPAGVRVAVELVGAGLAVEDKAVTDQSGDNLTSSEAGQLRIVDGHELDGYGDVGLGGHLDIFGGPLGNGFPMLEEAFNHHSDDLANIRQRFFLGVAPGSGPLLEERGTISREAVLVGFHDNLEDVGLHSFPPV
jgi:hypothetical protein